MPLRQRCPRQLDALPLLYMSRPGLQHRGCADTACASSYGFHTGYPTILCHQGDAVAGGEARLYYGDHPSAEGTREFAFRPISFHRTGAARAVVLQLP